MRLMALTASLALLATGRQAPATTGHQGPPAATHVVRMQGNRFVPAELTIASGDTVRFVLGSGGPHNVAFYDLKAESAARLRKLMRDTIGDLSGPLLITPGQSYNVVFAEVPPGVYPYWCVPHVAGGMVATITVR